MDFVMEVNQKRFLNVHRKQIFLNHVNMLEKINNEDERVTLKRLTESQKFV